MADAIRRGIRLAAGVDAEIATRGANRTATINRDLGRYYDLLAGARKELAALIADEMLSRICDDTVQGTHCWQTNLDDALGNVLAGAWLTQDADALLTQPIYRMALLDVVERYAAGLQTGHRVVPTWG